MDRLYLHDYQVEATHHLYGRYHAGIFLDPGLGKTAIMITVIKELLKHGDIDQVLIVAPIRVMYTVWPMEFKKWGLDEEYTILHGPKKDDKLLNLNRIILTAPSTLGWLQDRIQEINSIFTDDSFLIVDESTFFKNPTSNRSKIIHNLARRFKRRVIMTGTPTPNGVMNLWSQMKIIDNGESLGKRVSYFRNSYFDYNPYTYSYTLKDGSYDRIMSCVDDAIFCKTNDELDLPDRIDVVISVPLEGEGRKEYDKMRDSYVTSMIGSDGEFIHATNAAVAAMKLKQISNGFIYDTGRIARIIHLEKVSALEDLIEELGRKPVLVFYEFKEDLNIIQTAIHELRVINSDQNADELRETIDDWNSGNIPVLALHPASGGHGLNLQYGGCHDIVWYSIPYDLELYDQAVARVHRQGVDQPVRVHHIVGENTIDEVIMQVLERKDNLQNTVKDYLQRPTAVV